MDPQQRIELAKQWRAAQKVDRERAEALSALSRHPGWAVFVSLIDSKLEADGMALLSPLDSMNDIPKAEHLKGTMYGLVLARDLPSFIVESMKAQDASDPAHTEDDDNDAE